MNLLLMCKKTRVFLYASRNILVEADRMKCIFIERYFRLFRKLYAKLFESPVSTCYALVFIIILVSFPRTNEQRVTRNNEHRAGNISEELLNFRENNSEKEYLNNFFDVKTFESLWRRLVRTNPPRIANERKYFIRIWIYGCSDMK